MANIALVTSDTAHVGYVNTRNVLISGGHSVTGLSTYNAATLATYDIIVCVRVENNLSKSQIIKQALDMGTPVLFCDVAGTTSPQYVSNGPAVVCGMCLRVRTNDQFYSMLKARNHPIFDGLSSPYDPYLSLGFTYSIPKSEIASSATTLAVFSEDVNAVAIAILQKGSININGDRLNASIGFCGFIHGGTGYSDAGTQIFLRIINLLLASRYLRGTVKDADGNALVRKLRALVRSDGSIAGEAISDAISGQYELSVSQDTVYTVVCYDEDGGTKNALIKDRVVSVPD